MVLLIKPSLLTRLIIMGKAMKKIFVLAVFHMILLSPLAQALSLRDCLRSASQNNPALGLLKLNESISSDDVDIAESARLPRIDGQAAYTIQNLPQSIKIGPASLDMQDSEYPSANFSITQVIYDFGRTTSRIKRSENLKEFARQTYRSGEQEVFIKVVEAYYGILEAGKNLKAADDEIIQMENHLKMAKTLHQQGVATKNDVLQAEVQLANSRQRKLVVSNKLENRWLTINFLTGRGEAERQELEEDQEVEAALFPDPDKADFSGHPEIMALLKMIDVSRNAMDEARSQYMPEVFGKVQADYLKNSQLEEDSILSASLGLKINMFDGYATTARNSQAYKMFLRSREALRETEKRLRLEYMTAVNDCSVAEKRIDAISKAITQGNENLRINRNKYEEHVGTATGVLDAQTLLTQTRAEYYRAVFDKEVSVARIKKATGELCQEAK